MPGPTPRIVGRYALCGEIAAGGMATVHFGRLLGPVGFARIVAIKCLHAHFAKDPEFVAMFLDEARLAARVRHPNVVAALDVVALEGELFLVMEYVQGEALSRLFRMARERRERIPPKIVAAIVVGVLHGLHAAHEATSELGEALGIVHRDVSPQNVLVGADGVARVLDFGIAKARGRIQITREGRVKGKTGYMSPEQLTGGTVDRRTDIYSASVLLWEALTGERLFDADDEHGAAYKVEHAVVRPPSAVAADLQPFDAVTLRGVARDPSARFASAKEMALVLERCRGIATPSEIAEWLERTAGPELSRRAQAVAEIEGASSNPSEVRRSFAVPQERVERTAVDQEAPTLARIPDISELPTEASAALMGNAERPTPARRGTVAVVLSAAATAALLLFFMVSRGHSRSAAAEPPATAPLPAMAAPASSVAAGVTPVSAPEEEPVPATDLSALPAASEAPPSSHHVGPAARPRPSCSPPYTVDAQGIRHIKRWCL